IHNCVVRPQPSLDFVAGNNLALTLKEHPQNLRRLFSEWNLLVRIGLLDGSEFTSAEVELKGSEQNAS
ncbi:MAG: hypothetical protein WA510_17900, partial [Acidobacteriaceae bacterium]